MTSKEKESNRLKKLFGKLAKLSDAAGRKEFLARHRELYRVEVVAQLDDAVREHLRVNLHEARALAEAALEIAEQIGDPQAVAKGLRAKANALWFMGENKSAAELHEQSAMLFRESGATLELGRTLSVSIQPLILLGDYERALVAAAQAREIFKSLGEAVRLARLEINIGNIFHRQDRFAEAVDCYERAYQGLLPDKDKEGIAASLHNVAVCLISLNDFRRALSTYEGVREFCDRHNMPLAVVQADYNIAYLYYLRGEYSRAIEMLRAARASCQEIGDVYHRALCDLDLSEIYLELNLSEEAAETAQEALVQFQHLKMRYEAAKSLANLAIALSQQNKGFRALEYFAQARDMFLQEKNQVWPSLIDLYQALVLYNEGRLFEARRLAANALDFFGSSILHSKAILCRLVVARLSLRTGELESARRECQISLQLSDQIDSTVLKYQASFLMGQVEESAQNLQVAYRYYQAARESLETLRSSLWREELKIAFIKNRMEVYENLVDLCLSGDASPTSAEEALSYMEQAKSRTLRDLLFGRSQPLSSSGPVQSELVRRIRDLREELNWYYHRIEIEQLRQGEQTPEHIQELQAQVREREKDFLRALREVPSSEDKDSELETDGALTLDSIRSALAPDSLLLEYFRVRDRIVVGLLTRDRLEIVPLTLAPRLGSLLRMFQFQLSKFHLDPGYVRSFGETLLKTTRAHLRDLYNELLAPVRQRLDRRHLIIVPHDILHYLPFHALHDGERYLIDAFTVSYAPSASIYALCHRKTATPGCASLILGVPDPQTPYILEEVQSVAAILPQPELFLGAGASENVLRNKGPRSRFVHIATHGRFRKDNPMFSSIRLGGSYLNLYDLYSLKLPAELVTLSGCATGVNVVAAGDELLGLVRGFLYAGAQSLLLTLWDVQDKSTSEFMKSFYGHLGRKPDKALALQSSMQELRERYPHPYYWAPFILVGQALSS